MKGLPPEVDRLMWAVAENPTPAALDEFGERYPQYRSEMLRRIDMVKSLRNEVRPQFSARKNEIPKFQMRETPRVGPPRGLFFVGALGIAAIAAASYTVYSGIHTVADKPKPAPLIKPIVEDLPQPPPVIYNTPPEVTLPYTPAPTPPPQPVDDTPAYRKPKTIRFKDQDLVSALAMITEGSGIHLEPGPGFVNQKVTVDYRDMDTISMLKDMARQYGFHIFDEGNNSFLAIPIPDEGSNSPTTEDHLKAHMPRDPVNHSQ